MDKIAKVKEILDEHRGKHHIEYVGSGYAFAYDVGNEELAQAICQLDEIVCPGCDGSGEIQDRLAWDVAGATEPCPTCKGEGLILETFAEADNDEAGGSHDVQEQVPCPTCQGSGKAKPKDAEIREKILSQLVAVWQAGNCIKELEGPPVEVLQDIAQQLSSLTSQHYEQKIDDLFAEIEKFKTGWYDLGWYERRGLDITQFNLKPGDWQALKARYGVNQGG